MESNYVRVGGKYVLRKRIGGGSFGDIFFGSNLETQGDVAIKLENLNSTFPQLVNEAKIIRSLRGEGVPKVFWSGTEGNYNIMVMELLGLSLEDVFKANDRRMSTKSACMICDQMIQRIETVHSQDYIHRDIKPENFLFGLNDKESIVYIIDFGLSKKYRESKTKQHIQYKDKKSLTGTARYASVYAHQGIDQTRRDDLEGIIYVFIYFLKGELPWQGLHLKNKQEKYNKIMSVKMSTSVENLCKGCPSEVAHLLNYCKGLRFEENPNYNYMREQLASIGRKENFNFDLIFEWNKFNHARHPEKKHEAAKEIEPQSPQQKPKKQAKKPRKKQGNAQQEIEGEKNPENQAEIREDDCKTVAGHRWPEFYDRQKIFSFRQKSGEYSPVKVETEEISTGKRRDSGCILF